MSTGHYFVRFLLVIMVLRLFLKCLLFIYLLSASSQPTVASSYGATGAQLSLSHLKSFKPNVAVTSCMCTMGAPTPHHFSGSSATLVLIGCGVATVVRLTNRIVANPHVPVRALVVVVTEQVVLARAIAFANKNAAHATKRTRGINAVHAKRRPDFPATRSRLAHFATRSFLPARISFCDSLRCVSAASAFFLLCIYDRILCTRLLYPWLHWHANV